MDEKKFKELVLYIAKKSERDPHFGAVKLNKILFYSEFLAYATTGKSITGEKYRALERGPGPWSMPVIRAKMEKDKDCAVQATNYLGEPETRIVALRDPDLSMFNGSEIAVVNTILDALRKHSGKDASYLSHTFMGWKAAGFKEEIPYTTVFVSGRELSYSEKQHALELEPTGNARG